MAFGQMFGGVFGGGYSSLFANILANGVMAAPKLIERKIANRPRPYIKDPGLGDRLMELEGRLARVNQATFSARVMRTANAKADAFIHSRNKNHLAYNEYTNRTILTQNYANAANDIKARAMEQEGAFIRAKVAKLQGDISIKNEMMRIEEPKYNPYVSFMQDMFLTPMIENGVREIGNAIRGW